jgi:Putative Actinobacterial Holin-X, holin superfamily III
MPTQETDSQGLGAAVKEVAERTSSIVRLELELAALELRRKVVALGLGIGFGLGAAVMLVFMVAFVYAAIGAALALVMPTWAALLVVAGILLLQAALFALLAVNRIKKGTPPLPEQAIQEAKLTTEALKSNGR